SARRPRPAGDRPARRGAARRARTLERTRSSTPPALHLAEDVFRQQLLEIDGRLNLTDLTPGADGLVRAARADPIVLRAAHPFRFDRRDRVLLELDARLQPQGDPRLIVGQRDRLPPADLDARDLHIGTRLEPADRGEVDCDSVAAAPQER